MNNKRLRAVLTTTCAVLGLVSCGGGGNDSTAGGGIGGSGFSVGSIDAFGSIVVNGVHFKVTGAAISHDGKAIDEKDLRLGMTVQVQGLFDNASHGTANTVVLEQAVRGFVTSTDPATRQLVVLGQTVITDDTTKFDGFDNFAAIHANDPVEVFGFIKSPGVIVASLIQFKTLPISNFVIRGIVSNNVGETMDMGTLHVDYAGAVEVGMPTDPAVSWDGLFVRVEGKPLCQNNPCSQLTVTTVEIGRLPMANAMETEFEGFITATSPTSATQFTIGHQVFMIGNATVFSGGVASDLVIGAKVEVKGPLVGGVINATHVSFEDGLRFEANVAMVTVTTASSSFTLAGLPGIVVGVDNQTVFKSSGGGGVVNSLADIAANDHLRIRARLAATGSAFTVVATEVEMLSPDPTVVLQGPVQSVSLPSVFRILGISVDTSVPGFVFKDANDNPINAGLFFSVVKPGTLVKSKGSFNSPTVVWGEVELEN